MITISTGGIGPMDIVAGTKSKGTSKEEKAVDAFASLMNMVSTKSEDADMAVSQDVDVTEVAPTKETTKDYETYSKQEEANVAKDKLQNAEKTVAKEDTEVSKSKNVDSKASDEEGNLVDKAVELIKEVKEVLKDALNISDEELEGLLADMGIDISQLLIGDNLKNFILQVQGASNVDLLVNENLANLVSDVTNKVAEIIQNFELDTNIDFEKFVTNNVETIENALQNMGDNVDIIVDDVPELNGVVTDANVEVKDVTIQGEEAVDGETDVTVKTTPDKQEATIGDKNADAEVKLTVNTSSNEGQQMTGDQTTDQSNQQIQASFNQALDNSVNANVNVEASTFTNNVQEADIIRQIIDQIKVNVSKEVQSMEVQLNPENLGKVYVNVEAKDGVMQAKIIAETESAKNAIENNLAILKENFSNNEIKVEAIEVMVAAYGFFEESSNGDFDNEEQANDTSKAIGGLNVNDLNEEELTEEEELEVEIMKTKGNTVSYTV